jgi:signal transduction histidine kinase
MLNDDLDINQFYGGNKSYLLASRFIPAVNWRIVLLMPQSASPGSVKQALNKMDSTVDKISAGFSAIAIVFLLSAIIVALVFSFRRSIKNQSDYTEEPEWLALDDEDLELDPEEIHTLPDISPNISVTEIQNLPATEKTSEDLPEDELIEGFLRKRTQEDAEDPENEEPLPSAPFSNLPKTPMPPAHLAPGQNPSLMTESYDKMVEALHKVNKLEKEHSIELSRVNKKLQKQIQERKRAEDRSRLLTRRLIHATEESRKQLARDLHDEFGQSLAALHLDLNALWKSLPEGTDEQKKRVDGIIDSIEQLGDKIRNISSELRPDLLDDLGLVPTLEWYVEDYRKKLSDFNIHFQVAGLRKRLSSELELIIYRIFQECMNNILKHAQATEVNITLAYSHPNVIFTVRDNGVGFDHNAPTDGIGLLGMQERAVSVKGNVDIHTAKDKGTTIRVELPVTE